ncbi:hypothetical protein EVAR_59158_1 [Eumeta japonica]|uniref:Uncharacterized protein n=1 Tax=Eumeta variegata TaxID=151549 RepID=A0A4C1YXE6_EUMVA|nr:hypothetical protein EVAR_59158_1 [Eumeta japonica]
MQPTDDPRICLSTTNLYPKDRPLGKRNVGRPAKRWADDIIKVTGRAWMNLDKDREETPDRTERASALDLQRIVGRRNRARRRRPLKVLARIFIWGIKRGARISIAHAATNAGSRRRCVFADCAVRGANKYARRSARL